MTNNLKKILVLLLILTLNSCKNEKKEDDFNIEGKWEVINCNFELYNEMKQTLENEEKGSSEKFKNEVKKMYIGAVYEFDSLNKIKMKYPKETIESKYSFRDQNGIYINDRLFNIEIESSSSFIFKRHNENPNSKITDTLYLKFKKQLNQ